MRKFAYIAIAGAAAIVAPATLLPKAHADSAADRGKYLVTVAGCNDCHTPGYETSVSDNWTRIAARSRLGPGTSFVK